MEDLAKINILIGMCIKGCGLMNEAFHKDQEPMRSFVNAALAGLYLIFTS